MSELHVLMPDGQQSVCTEDQVNDLLEQGVITLENYYWQEGMEEWRPLQDLATPDASSETAAEDISEVSPEVLSEAPIEAPAATPFKAHGASSSTVSSETSSKTRSSVPSFVPPRRVSDPSLPVSHRPVVPPPQAADPAPTKPLSEESATPVEDVPQPQVTDAKSAVPGAKKEVKSAAAVEQLEFTDAPSVVPPSTEEPKPAAPVPQPQSLVAESPIRFEKMDPAPGKANSSLKTYGFRKSPLVLTVGLQILLALSLLTIVVFLYQCYGQVYGGDDSTALLMGSSAPTGVSDGDTAYFFDFIWILVGIHILIESLFFCWVYLANFNCRGFIPNMTYTPGWAVAYFFIPFLNLFRPYQVMQEIWKVSENPQGWLGKRNSIFVGFWFLCRLAIIVISHGPFHTSYSGSPDPHIRMLGTLCYLMVVELIVFFIELTTLILVSVVTSRQMKLTRP